MLQHLLTFGALIGGIGLFLLAVRMITDGLRIAAGGALRTLLARWTGTPLRGLATGAFITAVTQSSSAVTVALIGFVNAGLMNLRQALGVIYGANVGTTMIGWLVVAIGFNTNIEMLALPLIGIGMILRMTRAGSRIGALGEALAGFGLFFVGIDVLKDAFDSVASGLDLYHHEDYSLRALLLHLGLGLIMTILTQSSAAAIAVTLTATAGGLILPELAAAMIIGANVGTTSTAALAAIGATANAKRVAAAHVVFNLITGAVAVVILPLLFWAIRTASTAVGIEDGVGVSLALFHTVFNVLGVLIMWPLTGGLSRFLAGRFRSMDEIEATPKFLDRTVVVTPELALNAMALELDHLARIARRMAQGALSTDSVAGRALRSDHAAVTRLAMAIGEFMTQVEKATLSQEVAQQLPRILHTVRYYSVVAELALQHAEAQATLPPLADRELAHAVGLYKADAVAVLTAGDPLAEGYEQTRSDVAQQQFHEHYHRIRDHVLTAGAGLRIDIPAMSETLEQLNRIDRMIAQFSKGVRGLHGLLASLRVPGTPGKLPPG